MRSRPLDRKRLDDLLTWTGYVELRHDVDCCPEAAMVLAAYEATLRVKATYHIWYESPDYTADQGEALAEFVETLGHDTARHLTEQALTSEWVRCPGPPLGHFSLHNPGPGVLFRYFPGFYHDLGPEWKGRYYSDSRGSFRFSDPEDHAGKFPIKLNLHPDRWMGVLLGHDHPLAVDALERARRIERDAGVRSRL